MTAPGQDRPLSAGIPIKASQGKRLGGPLRDGMQKKYFSSAVVEPLREGGGGLYNPLNLSGEVFSHKTKIFLSPSSQIAFQYVVINTKPLF